MGESIGEKEEAMRQISGVKTEVTKEIIDLARKYNIKKLIVFGSRARNDYKERSDIDLAVSGGDILRFTLDLDERVQTLLMFDVVNLDGAVQDELRQAIAEEGIIIYEKI